MTSNSLREGIWSAYREYAQAVNDSGRGLSAVGDLVDAVASFSRTVDDAFSVEAGQRVLRAYERYVVALQYSGSPEQARRDIMSAYQDLLDALWELLAPADAQKRLSDAQNNYVRALNDALAPVDVQDRLNTAYGQFLQTVQDLWAQADVASIDSESLLVVAQTLARAATVHATGTAAAAQASAATNVVRSVVLSGVGQQMLAGLGSLLDDTTLAAETTPGL